jgi:hypothetical protein
VKRLERENWGGNAVAGARIKHRTIGLEGIGMAEIGPAKRPTHGANARFTGACCQRGTGRVGIGRVMWMRFGADVVVKTNYFFRCLILTSMST